MRNKEFDLKKILSKIPNNYPTVIHSDLLSLGKYLLNNQDEIKNTFIKHFSKGILIPAFNLNKKKILRFDKFEHSMGALTNMFIKKKNFFRILNPIHSYIFSKITIKKNIFKNKSFGNNSIFDLFYKKNFMWVNFGASNNEGFTLFHHAESICNVPYRYKVFFKRTIISKINKKKILYEYFARKRLISYNFDKAVNDMLKNKILKKINIKENYFIIYGHCTPILNFIVKKIKKSNNYLLK